MSIYSFLESFEGLSLQEQAEIIKPLVENNFCVETHTGVFNTSNTFYYKSGVDKVLVFINQPKYDRFFMVIIDKEVFETYFQGNKFLITMRVKTRGTKANKYFEFTPHFHGGDKHNVCIHQLVCPADEGQQVDHISHNHFIATKDMLRMCSALQNNHNKKFRCKIHRGNSFKVLLSSLSSADKMDLSAKGFRFTKDFVYSPTYSSAEELYNAIDNFEKTFFGEFRYNPLIDYSETIYVYILRHVLQIIDDATAFEYMRQYHIKYHPEIAEYYQLGE